MATSYQIAKSFACKFCVKGYTSLSALKMRIRTQTFPCKCDICGKSFSRPLLLQGHVLTHTVAPDLSLMGWEVSKVSKVA